MVVCSVLISEGEEGDVYVLGLAVFGFTPRDLVDVLNFIIGWVGILGFGCGGTC